MSDKEVIKSMQNEINLLADRTNIILERLKLIEEKQPEQKQPFDLRKIRRMIAKTAYETMVAETNESIETRLDSIVAYASRLLKG